MITVAGDMIVDHYLIGDADRLSPEAPVPVMKNIRKMKRPGGADNVYHNIRALGAEARLIGSTRIHKKRVFCQGQQVVRLDYGERCSPIPRDTEFTGDVVFSDYGKGSLLHIEAFMKNCRAFIDPKGELDKYRGAFVLTPNRKEFVEYAGNLSRASEVRNDLNIEHLCITLGEDGIMVINDNETIYPAQRRPVYDVTGAGDTVLAVLAVAVQKGYSIARSAQYANAAAGIVIQQLGTGTVTADEIALC